MKFVDLNKLRQAGRAFVGSFGSVQREDVEDPQRLVDSLRRLYERVGNLETRVGPEAQEFEVSLPAFGNVTINHGLKGPYRWYVTHWFGSTQGPLLRTVPDREGFLVLESSIAGNAVIRIEPSQYGLTPPASSLQSIYGPAMGINGLRLSLTSGLSVTTADVTAATTVYLTPHTYGAIALWDGMDWTVRTTGERSKALGTLVTATNYDVFAYWTGSTVELEFVAWAGANSRATALALRDGIQVKSTDHTRRYVGTFRTTATTTTEDSRSRRFLWNVANQVPRPMYVTDPNASWTYTLAANTWRQVRGSAANRVEYVCGGACLLRADVFGFGFGAGAPGIHFAQGVGIDSTTVNSGQVTVGAANTAGDISVSTGAYEGFPSIGYHAVNWLEAANWNNVSFFGTSTIAKAGLVGRIEA